MLVGCRTTTMSSDVVTVLSLNCAALNAFAQMERGGRMAGDDEHHPTTLNCQLVTKGIEPF
jgi:hypothetical protein